MLLILAVASATLDCQNAGADSQIAQCWGSEAEKADAELNRLWPSILKAAHHKQDSGTLRPTTYFQPVADLLASQRAWLKFRDAQCALDADYAGGGSLTNILYAQCETEMTRARIKVLQETEQGFME